MFGTIDHGSRVALKDKKQGMWDLESPHRNRHDVVVHMSRSGVGFLRVLCAVTRVVLHADISATRG